MFNTGFDKVIKQGKSQTVAVVNNHREQQISSNIKASNVIQRPIDIKISIKKKPCKSSQE